MGIHLVVDAVLRIDTWFESDGTALDVRVLSQQLLTKTVHDFRPVQTLLNGPVPTARGRFHLVQGVVNAQLCRAQRLTGFLHGLLIDRITGMVKHDEEGCNEENRHESDHPQHNLRG